MRDCSPLEIVGGTRIAHCITGTVGTNRKDRKSLLQQHPLTRKFLDELSAYNVTSELFLVLDLRPSGWPVRTMNTSHHMEAQRALIDRLSKTVPEIPSADEQAAIDRMLASLRPVRFISYTEPPLCGQGRGSRCLCTRAFPSFWEMVAKNDACMDAVQVRALEIPTRELSQSLHPANHKGLQSVARVNLVLTGARGGARSAVRLGGQAGEHATDTEADGRAYALSAPTRLRLCSTPAVRLSQARSACYP